MLEVLWNMEYRLSVVVNPVSSLALHPCFLLRHSEKSKIVVVSNFAKKGFENGVYNVTDQTTGQQISNFRCQAPIQVINYPVRRFGSSEINLDITTDFNFLVVAQAGPRKNFANTTLTVTIPASGIGKYQDTVHTVSFAKFDTITTEFVNNATTVSTAFQFLGVNVANQ